MENVFPTLIQPKSSLPLNFGALETLTSNPDLPTSLANIETMKLINLKALAKHTPDGLSTKARIICNPISETGLSLPAKRTTPKSPAKRQSKQFNDHFTTDSLDSTLETDPTTLGQTMNRPDWPQWKMILEAENSSLKKWRFCWNFNRPWKTACRIQTYIHP